jgi:hypothetical protein
MKPANVVVNYKKINTANKCSFTKMRMIDFGQYCDHPRIDSLLKKMDTKTKQFASRSLMLLLMQTVMKSQIYTDDPKLKCSSRENAWNKTVIFQNKIKKYTQENPLVLTFLESVSVILVDEMLTDISESLVYYLK